MKVGSLFSGIDGLALGVQFATYARVAWHSEIDPAGAAVLARHWHAPNLGDVTAIDWSCVEPVDVLVGGFPCQDISQAGKGAGIDGERSGLWREIVRALRALRPRFVFVENVAALFARGFGRVASDLAESGYCFAWSSYSSAAVGAPHRRERVFILATPDVSGERREGERLEQWSRAEYGPSGTQCDVADSDSDRREGLATGRPCSGLASRDDADGRDSADADAAITGLEGADEREPEQRDAIGLAHRFGPAMRRWGSLLGREAPPIAVAGVRGGPVLNPDFSEWMMGFPPGWTADVGRTARLRLIGNAVQPQVAQAAWVGLRERLRASALA